MAGVTAVSKLARAQYAALATMRWSTVRHGFRSTQGAIELGARVVVMVIYSVMGLGLATALGGGAYALASNGQWSLLPPLMWIVLLLWQIVPVSLASFQQQFDLGGLLRFPVSFGAFYVLHLVFGLIDISTIMGAFCCTGIWIGISLARPALAGWAALGLLLFALFNVFTVRAVFAWIDRWLAQRRTREIVTGVFLLALLSLNFINPALRGDPKGPWISAKALSESRSYLKAASAAQSWLPPGLAARSIRNGSDSDLSQKAESLALLGLYTLCAGGVLGLRLRAEYRGESLGEAPSRKKAEVRTRAWLLDGSGPIAAVLEKELRTLFRALPLLYGLGAPLLMVFVFSGLFKSGGNTSIGHVPFGLLVCLAYAVVGFTQLFYNNLGPEGPGIQLLFLSPIPFRTVLFAKNVFHALLFGVDAVLVCIAAALRYGAPEPMDLLVVGCWVLFALPVHLTAGNAFSIVMPYRVNLGRLSRQKGSQGNALLSMTVQLGVLGAGAGIFVLGALLHLPWLPVPVFLLLGTVAGYVWLRLLPTFEGMAQRRRDDLIATLVKTE